jgi:uncharacterized protein (DUF433 family)
MLVHHIAEKIEIKPGFNGGQPRIAGTRFTVKQIVVWHEYMGMSIDEIADIYQIEPSAIHAALAYYFDNAQEIKTAIREDMELAEVLKKQFPSKLRRANV